MYICIYIYNKIARIAQHKKEGLFSLWFLSKC